MSAGAVSSPTRKYTPAPRRTPKPETSAPSSERSSGSNADAPSGADDARSDASRQARSGAREVIKAAQKPRTDAARESSAEERRDDNRAGGRDENISPEATLANQDRDGQDGASIRTRQRGSDRDAPERPEDEDGTSLDAHAVNRARAAARDGRIDKDAFRSYLRGEGERADDGPEAGTSYSPTTIAGISEALHQDSLVLRDGRRDTVEQVERGEQVPVGDRVEALAGARQERATLEAESAALEELEENEEFRNGLQDSPDQRGVESIDGDGEVETDHGEVTPIVGLTQSDIDARQEAIDEEIAAADEEIELLAASFTADEEAALRDAAEADEGLELASGDGETIQLDDEVVDAALEDVERAQDAPAAPPEGADAGPDAAAAPSDEQLLDQAAADGVIDANARDQFAFNDAGELTYAAQPGDGYWQAAEHVAPPAGQDFTSHWQSTWTENSQRNHGVPDEQFVAIGQQVVIPGYSRDQFIAAYAPPPVDPAVDPAVDAGGDGSETGGGDETATGSADGTETDGATDQGGDAPAGAAPTDADPASGQQPPPGDGADPSATVMAGEHEVYAQGGDAVSTDGGGLNVYSDGTQLAHVYDDGRVELAEGVTDADLQAFLGTQLLYELDDDGSTLYGYAVGDGAELIEDPNHIEGYDILLAHYAGQQSPG